MIPLASFSRSPLALIAVCSTVAAACATPTSAGSARASADTKDPMHVPIVQAGHPVLRSRAQDIPPDRIGTPEVQDLVARMIETMRQAPGVGLAAPQIGVPWRVFVLEDREERMASLSAEERQERGRVAFGPRVFFNPTLRPIGDEKALFFEGCLSVPGYAALVERASEVEVSGLDEHGAPQTWRVRGWPARILQHEFDHLEGTLYVDRMKTRSLTTLDQAKALYGGKPIAEVIRLLELDHELGR